jgi:hypothetical protein
MGKVESAVTSATISGDGASDVISHDAPTCCNWLPIELKMLASQIALNTPCLKGDQVPGPRS